MASYVISSRAYFKIFFHAAKHPHQPVNGVLVGKEEAGIVTIVDIIPLLHHWTSLSPMMEIGLDLVRLPISLSYNRLTLSLKAGRTAESMHMSLVGYYQASERIDDTALAPVGQKIASKVKEGFGAAVAFVVRVYFLAHIAFSAMISRSTATSWEQAMLPSSCVLFSSDYVLRRD